MPRTPPFESWSLFGMQRITAWGAPLMGRRFVAIRVLPSLSHE